VFGSGRVHENPVLPEAFHERRMHEFGGESRVRTLPSPEKKLRFAEGLHSYLYCTVQFSLFLADLLSRYLHTKLKKTTVCISVLEYSNIVTL